MKIIKYYCTITLGILLLASAGCTPPEPSASCQKPNCAHPDEAKHYSVGVDIMRL